MNIFKFAVENKFRFYFKGSLSIEDVFDLDVKSLDLIFQKLNSELKQTKEESLLDVKTKENKELEIKISIIKEIVQDKLEKQALLLKTKEIKEQKQKILEIMANKKDQDLQGKTIEELEAMLGNLG
jgi:hypothetical protein